ncbi:hypothetical protein PGTUg99_014621 [Puccinia graminis f. sp. tritici]|uniref:Uncharacterized protein n=1 Tax=Puccinia graminis f. sp. tritici TaxID=56615 RepID=A0A5B0S6R2_PUCGR|nr:hypothetical protein PGTUg99_014621 [Puccinia graminis f. sp. tritici]
MARLSDLPAELIHRIIDLIIHPKQRQSRDHHDADHNEIEGMQQKSRPHRVFNVTYRPSFRHHTHTWQVNHVTMPEAPWPEGLPSNPLLPLSMVSRCFRRCAQEKLFKNVALVDQWQTYLFHRTITRPSPQDRSELTRASTHAAGTHEAQDNETESADNLARHVRSLQFKWAGHCSMGKGGGSLVCEILRRCSFAENVAISTTFLDHCKEPIMEACATQRFIKDFVIVQKKSSRPVLDFQWRVDEMVTRLFPQWNFLETAEFVGVSSPPVPAVEPIRRSIPVLNSALRTITLKRFDLDEMDLSLLLKGSRETLRKLQIITPSIKLDRRGLCRILKDDTNPDLEYLKVEVGMLWHPIHFVTNETRSDDPAKNLGLLDIVFKSSAALRNLKSLVVDGPLTGSEFFTVLPQSVVKLAWNRCSLSPSAFAQALSSWRDITTYNHPSELHLLQPTSAHDPQNFDRRAQWLPHLKCCSVHEDDTWSHEELEAIEKALEARRVCFHIAGERKFTTREMYEDELEDNFLPEGYILFSDLVR